MKRGVFGHQGTFIGGSKQRKKKISPSINMKNNKKGELYCKKCNNLPVKRSSSDSVSHSKAGQ